MANSTYTNITANGDTDGTCASEYMKVIANGTWDSGTLTLKEYNDAVSGDYVAIESWTADISKSVQLGAGTKYRLTMAGAGGSLDLDVLHGGIFEK